MLLARRQVAAQEGGSGMMRLLKGGYLALIYAYLYIPIAVLIAK